MTGSFMHPVCEGLHVSVTLWAMEQRLDQASAPWVIARQLGIHRSDRKFDPK